MSSELRHRWTQAGGTIPDSWKIITLESLLKDSKSIAVGVMYPGPDTIGGVPLIKVGDIKGGQIPQKPTYCISQETNNEHRRTQLVGDELLITLVGNPGECVVVTPAMAGWNPARAIAVIRLSDPELRVYLKTVLESAAGKHLIDAVLNTTVQKTLNLKDVRQLPIPMPPRESIRSISAFSEALAERINLLRETNATLEAIAQALFKSWFVDFEPVHANAGTKDPSLPPEIQALFPATFTDSPQGSIPEGWERVTLDKISEVGIGKTPPRKEQHWFSESSSDTRWVSIRDMGMCGAYIATTSEFLTKEAVERFNVRVVPTNTVMLSFKMTIGRVAISDGAMTTNEAIAHFKLSEKSPISSEVIYLHLKSFDYSTLSSTSSIADAVNSKTVKNIPILLADASVLAEFQNRIEPIFGKIKVIEQQVQTLITLRDTLLPRLISSQLRLPEAEQAIAAITD